MRLLVVTPDGIQKIIWIEVTGKTSLPVLWDERIDGKMDDVMLGRVGGFKKLNGVLVFDQALKDANDAKKELKEKEVKDRKKRLKNIDKIATIEELKPLLKDLVEYLGL